ncbi:hypothetical protein MHYP_G00241500 [Metynnis hypsauchen]
MKLPDQDHHSSSRVVSSWTRAFRVLTLLEALNTSAMRLGFLFNLLKTAINRDFTQLLAGSLTETRLRLT